MNLVLIEELKFPSHFFCEIWFSSNTKLLEGHLSRKYKIVWSFPRYIGYFLLYL